VPLLRHERTRRSTWPRIAGASAPARPPRLPGTALRHGAFGAGSDRPGPDVASPLLVRPVLRARRPARWRLSTTRRDCGTTWSVRPPPRPPTPRDLPRPLPRGRPSRSTSTPCATGQEVWIGGIMQARQEEPDPLRRLGLRASSALPGPTCWGGSAGDRRDRPRPGRRRPPQRPVRRRRRRAVRDRGQPRASRTGALRLQGHGPAAGQAGLPDHARRP